MEKFRLLPTGRVTGNLRSDEWEVDGPFRCWWVGVPAEVTEFEMTASQGPLYSPFRRADILASLAEGIL